MIPMSSLPAFDRLRSEFRQCEEARFCGYVLDPEELWRNFTIEILIDGYSIKTLVADAYVHELALDGLGEGRYGFEFTLPRNAVLDGAVVEARLANIGTLVGSPILISEFTGLQVELFWPGLVEWLGGVRFSCTVPIVDDDSAATLDVFVDGYAVTRVAASGWTHIGETSEAARPARRFDFWLDRHFADGRVHALDVLSAKSERLIGSPVVFIAFQDGLERALDERGGCDKERLRAVLFDRHLPMSVPYAHYIDILQQFPNISNKANRLHGAVVVVGTDGFELTLKSLDVQSHTQWIAASVPAKHGLTSFDVDLVRDFLNVEAASCDFVLYSLAGTIFSKDALQRIADAFMIWSDARLVYGDVDILSKDDRVWPLCMPAFDYERMLEQGYFAFLFALRRATADECLAIGVTELYRLANSVFDEGVGNSQRAVHIPGSLARLPFFDAAELSPALARATRLHLEKRGIPANIRISSSALLPAVHVVRDANEVSTSIIIPTRNRGSLLRNCIESIRPIKCLRDVEILVMDNDSCDPETLSYLSSINGQTARVLKVPGPFNYSRLNNVAVRAARGELLCLLNNDVKALDADWFDEMLSRIVEPDVGAVGALLLRPNGCVQHAGIVLGSGFSAGVGFAAAHAFSDRIGDDYGYTDLLRVAHEVSAVTAACLVTRRYDYMAVEGMDEVHFSVNYNDVDYCLKLRSIGKRIVVSPHARLQHLESASRGGESEDGGKGRFERELCNLRSKWGEVLLNDPYYNPLLGLDPFPFSGLAWPPRNRNSRTLQPPVPRPFLAGF